MTTEIRITINEESMIGTDLVGTMTRVTIGTPEILGMTRAGIGVTTTDKEGRGIMTNSAETDTIIPRDTKIVGKREGLKSTGTAIDGGGDKEKLYRVLSCCKINNRICVLGIFLYFVFPCLLFSLTNVTGGQETTESSYQVL